MELCEKVHIYRHRYTRMSVEEWIELFGEWELRRNFESSLSFPADQNA